MREYDESGAVLRGLGMRLRDYSDQIPKPLVEVGHAADAVAPDEVLRPLRAQASSSSASATARRRSRSTSSSTTSRRLQRLRLRRTEGKTVDYLLGEDIHDWRITFVDTGLNSNIGERLRRVASNTWRGQGVPRQLRRRSVGPRLDTYVEVVHGARQGRLFLGVPAPHTFHIVHSDAENYVDEARARGANRRCASTADSSSFAARFRLHRTRAKSSSSSRSTRLAEKRQLLAVPYDGFWRNMDTFKDKLQLDEIESRRAPALACLALDGERPPRPVRLKPVNRGPERARPPRTASSSHATRRPASRGSELLPACCRPMATATGSLPRGARGGRRS